MLPLRRRKIEEIALRETKRGRVVLVSHIKKYEGQRPKPIGKNRLKPDLEIYSKAGKLLEIIKVGPEINPRHLEQKLKSFRISAARRGAKFKIEDEGGTSAKEKKTGKQIASKPRKQRKQNKESKFHKRVRRAETKQYSELSKKLLEGLANGKFESFYKIVKKEGKKHPDLYEELFGSSVSHWLKNRLLVIWDACVERGVKVSNVKITKSPSDYKDFSEQVLFRFYLSSAIDKIVELAVKIIPSKLAIFTDEFKNEILKKDVLFMIHQAN